MKIPIYWVDAFAEYRFTGNPAAVCVLDDYLDDDLLQAIATENNLSETAFLVRDEGFWHIRWFTPRAEVDLCGHATLGSAAVIARFFEPEAVTIRFESMSGPLAASVDPPDYVLDFPARPAQPADTLSALTEILGSAPESAWQTSENHMAVLSDEAAVRAAQPDLAGLVSIGGLGLIVTAPGETADFVSRFFAPAVGVDEDPVTGSAHCTLVPFWAGRLGKETLVAHQLSARGGILRCVDRGERVDIGGQVIHYLEGEISI